MARHGFSDDEWVVIEGVFTPPNRMGCPPMPARQALDGVCWILRVRAAERDLPKEPGSRETAYAPAMAGPRMRRSARAYLRFNDRFDADDRFDHDPWSNRRRRKMGMRQSSTNSVPRGVTTNYTGSQFVEPISTCPFGRGLSWMPRGISD